MEIDKSYTLPKLPYGYNELEPYISEEQLTIHHQKHHQGYVNSSNSILEKLDGARKKGTELDVKAISKFFSFNIGGHILHSLFWENMKPASEEKNRPVGALAKLIENEFGDFKNLKKEFTQVAISVEGSGWAVLTFDDLTKRLIIGQIEKHNLYLYPTFRILIALDIWEHAYYLDYKNERDKFIEGFWNIVNWDEVDKRLEGISK